MFRNQRIVEGSATSLMLRSMRFLHERGSPLPTTAALSFRGPDCPLTFGMICQTKDRRMIYWPPLPKSAATLDDDGTKALVDHVTLELDSLKTHVTAFDEKGDRHHHTNAWRALEFDEAGLATWFGIFAKWSLLEQQWPPDLEVEITAPPDDMERRKAELKKYVDNFQGIPIPMPERRRDGDYVLCGIHLVKDSERAFHASTNFPCNIADFVMGCTSDFSLDCPGYLVRVGDWQIMVTVATPPGQLNCDGPIVWFPVSHGKPFEN
jgi:hypothetical protein